MESGGWINGIERGGMDIRNGYRDGEIWSMEWYGMEWWSEWYIVK